MEVRQPTEAEKMGTAQALKNIANLLRSGLFGGQNAEAVAAAIHWLESGVSFFGVGAPISPADADKSKEEAPKPDLKAVPDEQK